MPGSSGYQELTVVIKTAPDEFETGIDTGSDIVKEITASREEIISAIRKAGIVGMGGAGYPTPIKTELPVPKSSIKRSESKTPSLPLTKTNRRQSKNSRK